MTNTVKDGFTRSTVARNRRVSWLVNDTNRVTTPDEPVGVKPKKKTPVKKVKRTTKSTTSVKKPKTKQKANTPKRSNAGGKMVCPYGNSCTQHNGLFVCTWATTLVTKRNKQFTKPPGCFR